MRLLRTRVIRVIVLARCGLITIPINSPRGSGMQLDKEELFRRLSEAVVAMNEEKTVELAKMVVVNHIDAHEAVETKVCLRGWRGPATSLRKGSTLFQNY